MSDWRPIETAPKDGTEFQAWLDFNGLDDACWCPRCRYGETGAFLIWDDEYGWGSNKLSFPTHWMPPPCPPVTT